MRSNLTAFLRRPWLAALGVGLISTGLAGLVSAHGGDATLVHGCVGQTSNPRGQLLVYSAPGATGLEGPNSSCGTRGQPLDWSGAGLAGASGAQGPAGSTGAAGATGAVGSTGASGPIANSVIGGTISNIPTTVGTQYSTIFGIDGTVGFEQELTMPSSGTVKNLQVKLEGPPGGSPAYQVIVVKNQSETFLFCFMVSGATTCGNSSSTVHFATTDTILVGVRLNAGMAMVSQPLHWAVTFVPD